MANIVYFVGAGFTKALAASKRPVPAMLDFISTCAEYMDDPVILTTLTQLELGDSYPYRWHSAEAFRSATKLRDLRRRTGGTDEAARREFAGALRRRPAESIEDLLGANADSQSGRDAEARFRFAIRRIFTLIGWDINWAPLVSFLSRQFAYTGSDHTFISFNYDLVLERGIQLVAGRVDASRIYGFPIRWRATEDQSSATRQHNGVPVRPLTSSGGGSNLIVLKPHGSFNWLVPLDRHFSTSASDEWRQGLSVVVSLAENGEMQYPPYQSLGDGDLLGCIQLRLPSELSPTIGATMEAEPVVMAPRGPKSPDRQFLCTVRAQQEAAIQAADEVYVLGWSIPRTDIDQECLIRSAVRKRAKPLRRVTVVNLHADVDYYVRAKDVFGVEPGAMRTHNGGFNGEFVRSLIEGA
jgi:hypothetical protein